MPTDPLLCDPAEKAAIEAENGAVQLKYLTELVLRRGQSELREGDIRELQALAIDRVYGCGATYRDALSRVTIEGSPHVPPEPALVPGLVQDLCEWINQARQEGRSALDRASYALWRLNWIHAFRGGNGRSSRCVAYLILCMDLGGMMPGTPTLPRLILDNREAYIEALREVDKSLRDAIEAAGDGPMPEPDLTAMTNYLRELVTRQMASAIAGLGASTPRP